MTNSGDAAENVVMSLYELTFMCIKNYWKGLINDIFLNETGRSVYFAVPVLCPSIEKRSLAKCAGLEIFQCRIGGKPFNTKTLPARWKRQAMFFMGNKTT